MKTIYEFKDKLRQMKDEILIKSNENDKSQYDRKYNEIYLRSVEEDIALWKKESLIIKDINSTKESKIYRYFYTDLLGNLLFNGKSFNYATPFSNSRACLKDGDEWLILDSKDKKITYFPDELSFKNINVFRNDSLALCNGNDFKWGSIKYNNDENIFEFDIPFIWNALDFSRENGKVYVGIYEANPIISNHPYFHYDEDFGTLFTIETMKLPIDMAKNTDYYYKTKNFFPLSPMTRYIKEEIYSDIPKEERKNIINDYLKTAYDISDTYFTEEFKEEFNNNKGYIVDIGDFNSYQKKLGKLIK